VSVSGDVNNYFGDSSFKKNPLETSGLTRCSQFFLSHASQNAQIVFSSLWSPYEGWGKVRILVQKISLFELPKLTM
jgi:hypothetical protein